jgi:hypothetical protein
MKYAFEIDSGGKTYLPSFMKIGRGLYTILKCKLVMKSQQN